MIANGSYLVFILSVTGMILPNDTFTDEEAGKFLQEIFRQHNVHRKKHGVKPLEFDKTICMEAGETLSNLSNGKTDDSSEESEDITIFLPFNDDTELDPNTDLDEFDKKISINSGESLDDVSAEEIQYFSNKYGYMFIFLPFKNDTKLDDNLAIKIVSSWYNTGIDYDYNAEPSNIKAEKFTQIVWASTEKMGLAMVVHEQIEQYAILVYYSPPGNQEGQYKNNVLRPES